MQIVDYGNYLIESDLKRLKKINSVEMDLQTYFTEHKNILSNFGKLSCEIAVVGDYKVCKERIAFSKPETIPSKGGRLWFVISKSGFYVRCLLYLAKEEGQFKKSVCFKIVQEKIRYLIAGQTK
ncbi:MAG: hypothetical protein WC741_02305 [Patescibacteria group bacterium]|jgi:hypothetical protein